MHNQVYFSILSTGLLFYSLCFHTNFVHGTQITSCDQTPYPKVCKYCIDTINSIDFNNYEQSSSFSTLHDQTLLVTMNHAKQVHQIISSVDLTRLDQKKKVAWVDCLELYEDTVEHLNHSILASKTNPIDSQTVLSASMTNLETCKNGFIDFKLPYHMFESFLPYNMVSNLSKLLSNSLALNKASITTLRNFAKQTHRNNRRLLNDHDYGFPVWVSARDRKLLQSSSPKLGDIVVAQDGSGNYKTIMEAVSASVDLRKGSTRRFIIYIRRGVYKEIVVIKKSMKNLMFVGDGIDATIVTGDKNNEDGSTTFRSATVGISGDGFVAKDMTFENNAGPVKHQAAAVRSGSDFSVFYNCKFKGYQDTLYVYSKRQFYRGCEIQGTQDFIFGNAAVIFQNCTIIVRKPLSDQINTVTAQARTDPNQNTGIIIHNSHVLPGPDLASVKGSVQSYLGRPWKQYSRTLFMKSELDGFIDPKGWLPWSGTFALSTLYYGEYMNTGDGASTSGRVKWPGYHVITGATEAGKFTVENFLDGGTWIPATGVPFDAGL